jgi:beta-RFAP synthase
MILEGIVTSLGSQGELNVAPMGPVVDEAFSKLVLRPFRTSRTYENLKRRPYGVFHVVDDVLLLARAAIGDLPDLPEHFAAHMVPGRVLASACRWYEFEVDSCDDREERTRIEARVVHSGRLRDFFGFNRAKHAVLEAAILATRLHLAPRAQIAAEFERLRTPVDKTAGPQEREAFERLVRFVESSGGNVPEEIVVTTGARLHFGLFAHGQAGYREFGGIGAMIDRPGFVIRAVRNEGGELHCGSWQPRVEEILARLCSACGKTAPPPAIEIVRAPPPHCGFGSGTQLALAIATIASIFAGESGVPAAELARRAGRGFRSAVGLYGFEQGGLIVESGHRESARISPLAARVEFPQEWRFVLVRPKDHAGISGGEEAGSFARLPGMDPQLSDRLCRIALTEILPAVTEGDFEGSAGSIGQFGRLVGEYFAPVQGGVFADPRLASLAERLAKRGIRGTSQTSWGPTVFILCPDELSAAALSAELIHDHELADCEITTAAPLNRGASVEPRGP